MSSKRKISSTCNVSARLYELKIKGSFCDVQLSLQGSTIPAHACVLASCSSYFLELFSLNDKTHWCARNPLVVDLETVLSSSIDLCVICVSKMVDFMYLKELVIAQNHCEHFMEINRLFGVFDSLLLDKLLKNIKSSELDVDEPKIELTKNTFLKGLRKNNKLSSEQALVSKTCVDKDVQIYPSPEGAITCTTLKDETKKSSCHDKLTPNIETSCEAIPKLTVKNNVSIAPCDAIQLSSEMNIEPIERKSCEFMCCNPEPDVNSSLAKLRKRRKMFCQKCTFSSVSIRKVLKHLQSTDHIENKCPVCLISLPNLYDLKHHLKCHSNSKPFICQICCKRNRYWVYHKMHLKTHCRNKNFYCDLCQRGFVSKRSLTEHLSLHKDSHLCKKCDYYTSDFKLYQSHLMEHRKYEVGNISTPENKSDIKFKSSNSKIKQFQCQICDERFTQKRNLARHIKSKHFDAKKLRCSLCSFISDRTDLLSIHLKKKHGCTLVKEKKKYPPKIQLKKEKSTSEFVSVLIPIKMVPEPTIVESHTLEDRKGLNENQKDIYNECFSFPCTYNNPQVNPNINLKVRVDRRNQSIESKNLNDSLSNSKNCKQNSIATESIILENKSKNASSSSQILKDKNVKATTNVNIHKSEDILERNRYIWLNESTGELLSDQTLSNLQVQNTFCKAKQNISAMDNPAVDYCEQLKSTVINEAVGEFSTLDFRDDNDEWSFPQTPQPGIMGIDDCESIFSWNQMDNSFYSTWVLNETTGELNMVSFFSIQSITNPTELKLEETSESQRTNDDNDTALFLNEGTGDLSVIYFNPGGPNSNNQSLEKISQNNMETHSDISDDDSDFLNEEFMRASANFISNEENNKFLNELTGEFDVACLNAYQPETLNCPVTGKESYLNEETGEISWNVMDDNALDYDLDDSLNCENFEPIFNDVNGFSSQFCLDKTSNNWKTAAEANNDDLVLNECTGELSRNHE